MKILVGLSGWVDSAVSALLLKRAGHEVHAGFMINYLEDGPNCTTRADLAVAKEVAAYLEIPFFTFDYRAAYEERIISYIYEGYARGLTPNPDILCNNLIKFDLFAQEARDYGYDKIAMGHYAQMEIDTDGKLWLLQWADWGKDQSYFLSRLSAEQLNYALFPIGGLLKSEVRSIAADAGLPNAYRKDSQGLCFIGNIRMKQFLQERLANRSWNIVDITGAVLSTHSWAHLYTIGQRKGIEIGGWPPLYVIRTNIQDNTVTVGPEDSQELASIACRAKYWISPSEIVESSLVWETLLAKIRYRQASVLCAVSRVGEYLEFTFKNAQRAVAPGQYIVLYRWNRVVGSAILQ